MQTVPQGRVCGDSWVWREERILLCTGRIHELVFRDEADDMDTTGESSGIEEDSRGSREEEREEMEDVE